MSEFKLVYLIVDRGDPEMPAFWRVAGTAFVCRDGSLNLKLDMFPGLRFNIRQPKSNGEREDAGEVPSAAAPKLRAVPRRIPKEVINKDDDDIPF